MVRLTTPTTSPILPHPPKGGVGENGPMQTRLGPKRGKTGLKNRQLPDRILAMADRWQWLPGERTAALAAAARDPAGWLAGVVADEALGITAADLGEACTGCVVDVSDAQQSTFIDMARNLAILTDTQKTDSDRDPKTETANPSHSMEQSDMLTVSAESSGTFEMCPAGPVAARCNRLIDLGSQTSEYQGESKTQRKLLVSWELAENRTDGEPFTISRRFGLSLHEKSALRGFLQAWRGRPFTDEGLAGFDLRKLLNAPCLLNIVHTERNGKSYANIQSITPLPRGMSAPELAAPPVVFDIDAPEAVGILETLSDSLVATIEASPEWQAKLKALGAGGGGFAADPLDDDVAF